ncbi:MAG: DMT family transporter [Dermatophilaceae bacterium]|nr:DMT family transporter [Dermatophilaceae bacterium]MBP9917881.1 DMT family transporter [Dermatophilaceae bacterium]
MSASPKRRLQAIATFLLVALTAVWGSTFFLIRDLVQTVPPADFLAIRFTLAAALMVALFWRPLRTLERRDVIVGMGLGALYGGAQLLQTAGLAHTDASVSGFITGTYVVLTPVITAALLRERVPASTWYAVSLATAGLALLSLNGVSVGIGETLTLMAAALYALHIIGLGRYSTAARAAGMSVVQMIVIAAFCLVVAVPDGITWPQSTGQWWSVIYMATAAGVLALWSQTWAQAHMTATRAAIVMTLEPVFAAGFAVALGGESLTGRMMLGGALVLAAMYVVELAGRQPDRPSTHVSEALHHDV